MTCFYCKGNTEVSTTTYMTDYNAAILLSRMCRVKNARNVDEEYLTGETLQNIENIIKQIKGMLTEIAVVDYQKTA